MLTYLPNESGDKYGLSYQNLRNDYIRFVMMSDDEFMDSLKEILHFACFVCWFKERAEAALADDGVIHSLVHLIGQVNCDMSEARLLEKTRDTFNRECCLA